MKRIASQPVLKTMCQINLVAGYQQTIGMWSWNLFYFLRFPGDTLTSASTPVCSTKEQILKTEKFYIDLTVNPVLTLGQRAS